MKIKRFATYEYSRWPPLACRQRPELRPTYGTRRNVIEIKARRTTSHVADAHDH